MDKMTVSQLSVFLENSQGTLLRVLDIIKCAGIQLLATTIADTSDYGICRIICDYPQKAASLLKEAGLAVALTEVFAVVTDNRPGAVADILRRFQNSDVNLPYLYSFMARDKYILVFRPENAADTCAIIEKDSLRCLTDGDLPEYGRS